MDDQAGSGWGRRLTQRRLELVATVILAVAALATTFSGYQASLWDGIQSTNYSRASALRTESAQKHTEANQLRLADLSVFESYLQAQASGEHGLAQFYRLRFRDEFEAAFAAWESLQPRTNPKAPPHPLAMPEYQLAVEQQARELVARAEATFAAGEEANSYSDGFTLATLFFAAVLFFAAISERFSYRPYRAVLLGIAALGLVGGTIIAASQPLTSG